MSNTLLCESWFAAYKIKKKKPLVLGYELTKKIWKLDLPSSFNAYFQLF